jgi:hypothetical protein
MRQKQGPRPKRGQNPDMLKHVFNEALAIFFARESANILNDVAERNLCGRLAMYLQSMVGKYGLTGYYADPDYNRQRDGQVKVMLDDQMQIVSITCDVILHSRGEIAARDNLIAIEMKKADRPHSEKKSDRARLRALTKLPYQNIWSHENVPDLEYVCGYEIGFYLELDPNKKTFLIEEYRLGELVKNSSGSFS